MKKEQKEQETRAKCAYAPPRIEVCASESCLILAGTAIFGGTHGDAIFNGATGTHGDAIFNGATGTHGDATFGGGVGTHLDAVAGGVVGNAKAVFSDPWE